MENVNPLLISIFYKLFNGILKAQLGTLLLLSLLSPWFLRLHGTSTPKMEKSFENVEFIL
jgi:hypothetical protein